MLRQAVVNSNNFIKCWGSFTKRYESQLARIVQDDGIRKVTMIDRKTRNALSMEMLDTLLSAVQNEVEDPSLRCIIITAEGSNVFCAGHNLKHLTTDDGKKVFEKCHTFMMSLVDCPVPVIAVVDGLAAAAGCQLVAQCDMAICSSRSTFSTPGANFGLFCSTPGIPLVRSVPKKMAAHMLFTGYPISAEQALQSGLVSKVTEPDKLDEELKKITDAIKTKSRSVIQLGKVFFYRQLEMDLNSAYLAGSGVMLKNLSLDDGQEGLKSFAEKRKPVWIHGFTNTVKQK